MLDLEGMSIAITGGGSGIGAGAARHFAAGGTRVTICGRRKDKIEAVAAEIGSTCLAVQADITDAADRQHFIEAAVDHGNGLGALISNAANMYRAPVETLDEQQLNAIFRSNITAGMLLTGLATPHLEQCSGAVIFVGSIHTRRAFPGASAYAATKGAVEALTRVLAADRWPKGIRVNCGVPGAVLTETFSAQPEHSVMIQAREGVRLELVNGEQLLIVTVENGAFVVDFGEPILSE